MNEESKKSENWKKMFKWDKSDILWIIFFFLIFFTMWGYKKDISVCREIAADPCKFCLMFGNITNGSNEGINWTNLNLTLIPIHD